MKSQSKYFVGSKAKAEEYAEKKNRKARSLHYSVKRVADRFGRDLYAVVAK